MTMYAVCAGDCIISIYDNYEDAVRALDNYEQEEKDNGTYIEDFYRIIEG